MVWRKMMNFSAGSVLMVLASKHYDENDYLRDYDEYVELFHRLENKHES